MMGRQPGLCKETYKSEEKISFVSSSSKVYTIPDVSTFFEAKLHFSLCYFLGQRPSVQSNFGFQSNKKVYFIILWTSEYEMQVSISFQSTSCIEKPTTFSLPDHYVAWFRISSLSKWITVFLLMYYNLVNL